MSNLFQPSLQTWSQMQTDWKQHEVQNSYRINKILIYRVLMTQYVMINLIFYCPFWNEMLKTFLKCFVNHDIMLLKTLTVTTKGTYEWPYNRYGDDREWIFWLQDTALKFFWLNNPDVKLLCGHLLFSLKSKESDIFAIALGSVS